MDPQAHRTLIMQLLNEHLSAARNKCSAIEGAITIVAGDRGNSNQYDRYLSGFSDDQERFILEGLQLLLVTAQADADKARAAITLYQVEGK